jgi:hypothetical protein
MQRLERSRTRVLVIGALTALIVGSAALFVASCSTKNDAPADVDANGEVITTDPCDPACCCRAKDNYYVRFSCMPRARCMADGGACSSDELAKCLTDTGLDAGESVPPTEAPL